MPSHPLCSVRHFFFGRSEWMENKTVEGKFIDVVNIPISFGCIADPIVSNLLLSFPPSVSLFWFVCTTFPAFDPHQINWICSAWRKLHINRGRKCYEIEFSKGQNIYYSMTRRKLYKHSNCSETNIRTVKLPLVVIAWIFNYFTTVHFL